MLTKQIGPLIWEVHSPAAFKLPDRELWLARDAAGWFLSGQDATGQIYYPVPDREAGAQYLYDAMQRAREGLPC